jgi:hypothetical protein
MNDLIIMLGSAVYHAAVLVHDTVADIIRTWVFDI